MSLLVCEVCAASAETEGVSCSLSEMMSELDQYLSILQSYDDPVLWDYPANFNYDEVQEKFFSTKNSLQSSLRRKLQYETGSYIQDASFHSRIFIPQDLTKNLSASVGSEIRFSNFGNMVTITDEENIKDEVRIEVVQVLIRVGYSYIPEQVLHNQYTGSNRGVDGINTWWVRYFDWV